MLLGRGYSKTPACLVFKVIESLSDMDPDALDFAAIHPNFNLMKYQPDGLHTMRKERDALAAMASDEDEELVPEIVHTPNPTLLSLEAGEAPSPSIAQAAEPPLATVQQESTPFDAHELNPAVPLSSLAPASASTSTTASTTTSPYLDSSAALPPLTGPNPSGWRTPTSNWKKHTAEFLQAVRPAKCHDAGTRGRK